MSAPNRSGNKPLIRRSTNRGNITCSVFRNQRVNRATGQPFVADNLVIRTGYFDAKINDWVNSDISIDARLIPNLIATLGHVDLELANNPAEAPAPAPAMQQPVTTPVAPEVEDVPF